MISQYCTRFPVLANSLEEALGEYLGELSKTGFLSRVFGPTEWQRTECTRTTNMLAFVRFLKTRLGSDDTEQQADLLRLAQVVVTSKSQKLTDIFLPKIIELSKDMSSPHAAYFLPKELVIDPSLGNKAFQDPKIGKRSFQLSMFLNGYDDQIKAVKFLLYYKS